VRPILQVGLDISRASKYTFTYLAIKYPFQAKPSAREEWSNHGY
jgi:hypothetical protein